MIPGAPIDFLRPVEFSVGGEFAMPVAPHVWLDGHLVAHADARISHCDHAVVTGDGVFESIAIRPEGPFALRRHLDRLEHGAEALGLVMPTRTVLAGAVRAVIDANGLTDGKLRLTITGGPGPLGSSRGDHPPTVIVAAEAAHQQGESADVSIVPWTRNESGALAGLKTVSYAENVRALAYARRQGADEALFANTRGELCEGTGTNVFVAVAGSLVTPPVTSGCLAGVTRALLLEITDAAERTLSLDDLRNADEAFLSSSTRNVQPIRRIDNSMLPQVPGPLTAAAAARFDQLLGETIDP